MALAVVLLPLTACSCGISSQDQCLDPSGSVGGFGGYVGCQEVLSSISASFISASSLIETWVSSCFWAVSPLCRLRNCRNLMRRLAVCSVHHLYLKAKECGSQRSLSF